MCFSPNFIQSWTLTFVVFLRLWRFYVRITVKFYIIAQSLLSGYTSPLTSLRYRILRACVRRIRTRMRYRNTFISHWKNAGNLGKADPMYCGRLHAFRIQTTYSKTLLLCLSLFRDRRMKPRLLARGENSPEIVAKIDIDNLSDLEWMRICFPLLPSSVRIWRIRNIEWNFWNFFFLRPVTSRHVVWCHIGLWLPFAEL